LPHIISGTSAGSVVGAIVCTRTDKELKRDMSPEGVGDKLKCFSRAWPDRIKSVWKTGTLFDVDEWMDMIQWFTCGDMTFEEAFKKTGRVFCVTLASTTKKAPPVLLNYISAPTVTIASAVVASAAVPGFIPPVKLQFKDSDGVVRTKEGETYFDGSIEQDIPVNGLSEMLNCQFFVACQCNPHVVPFFFNSKGGVGRPSRWSSGEQEDSWRGGFLLAALEMYLKNDMKAKFVFLNDLEAAVGFTSSMFTQNFVGSTTIVPQVTFADYFKVSFAW
jgi:predicted acylesterase/phospholipase RssA